MNKRLIEDEGSLNPMDVKALKERLAGWLETGEYGIDLISSAAHIVGYAVYQIRSADPPYVYLRQLYIERDRRGEGLGVQVMHLLKDTRFPRGYAVQIEVLAGNLGALKFYERVGFAPYATTMVWRSDSP